MTGFNRKNIADIYPLSPLQQGLLFESIHAPGEGLYVEQFHFRLRGGWSIAALQQAWQTVLDRHPILRTGFVWEGLKQPMQVVHRQLSLPWETLDWRGKSPEQQAQDTRELLASERRLGFVLTQAPLMKLTLIQLGPQQWDLIWSHHHLLLDGWSVSLLLDEVVQLAGGTAVDQLPARPPYRNYIQWHKSRNPAEAQAFWKSYLADAPGAPPLPFGKHPLSGPQQHREHVFSLDPSESSKLEHWAKSRRITQNTVFQGIWALLLARHANLDRVVFGTTASGRIPEIPSIEKMIGLFINTLPVVVDCQPDQTVAAFLNRLQEEQRHMRAYEDTPLADARAAAGISGAEAMFNSLQVFENFPGGNDATTAPDADTPRIDTVEVIERVGYPLSLVAGPGKQTRIRLIYDGRLYDDGAVNLLERQLRRLLATFTADNGAETPLRDLSLLDPVTAAQLKTDWHADRDPAVEATATMHGRFADIAARFPDADALLGRDGRLSYRELDQLSNRLANRLREQGVTRETPVALMMERGFTRVVAALAVWKAGGFWTSLNPADSAERRRTLLDQVGVSLILTDVAHPGDDQCTVWNWPTFDALQRAVADASDQTPSAGAQSTDLAYLIFTSGSTGEPKGVCCPHRGGVILAQNQQHAFLLDQQTRVLQFANFTFDACVWELCLSLLNGGALVTPDAEMILSGPPLHEQLQVWQVTDMVLPPSVAAVTPSDDLPALRHMVSAGESCSADLARRWQTGRSYFNAYGLTETAVGATLQRFDETSGDTVVPIGRAMGHFNMYLLDARRQPVAPGEIGELWLAGDGLARGYLDQPERTSERFFDDPFAARPGTRMFRTGDMARWNARGEAVFLGRNDHQVKIRGFRVELDAVRAVLDNHPAVNDSLIRVVDQNLVAYVLCDADDRDLAFTLKQFLEARLPKYMVPGHFLFLKAFPLNRSGKVDVAQLPLPDTSGTGVARTPQNPIEEIVLGQAAAVLERSELTLNANFFDAGGHSLKATQLLGRLRKHLDVDLPISAVFQTNNLWELAQTIADSRRRKRAPIVALDRTRDLPTSLSQKRLWFLDHFAPGNPAYNMPLVHRWRGDLDADLLQQALGRVVARHHALRSGFSAENGEPRVSLLEQVQVPTTHGDLRQVPRGERETRLQAQIEAAILAPFDLSQAPLLRLEIVRVDEREWVAVLTVHHIVSDGWSTGILLREWCQAYNALQLQQTPDWAPLPLHFTDFAAWQAQHLAGDGLAESLAFQKHYLGEPKLLRLPTDFPRPEVQTSAGAHFALTLDPARTARVRRFAREHGATLFITLLSVFEALMARYAGQGDFCVGTPIAGRDQQETEAMIGFFVNTLVLRARVAADTHFSDLVAANRRDFLAALDHAHLPFDQLVDELAPARDLAHHPIYQVMFNLQNTLDEPGASAWNGLVPVPQPYDFKIAQVDLCLDLYDAGDQILGHFEYNTDLFAETTIAHLADWWLQLLDSALDQPKTPIVYLPMLSDSTRQRMLRDWNQTQTTLAPPLHRVIEQRVAEQPQRIALVDGADSVTYAALNQAANRLARLLQAQGVQAGTPVGLNLPRGKNYAVAVLALFKLGALMVPLDAGFPHDRLAFMVADAGIGLLLTDTAQDTAYAGDQVVRLTCADWETQSASHPADNLDAGFDSAHPAMLIFTSGSTGRPKGVAVPHRALDNFCADVPTIFALNADDRVLHFASISFDVSLEELLPPLCLGARVVFRNEALLQSFNQLDAFIAEHQLTVLDLPTAFWYDWVNHLSSTKRGVPTSLRLMIVGGEKVPPEALAAWQRLPGAEQVRWLQAYGPSETTIASTYYHARPDRDLAELPIGKPMANTEIYLLDAHLEPVPVGVPGEIYIGGRALALGYRGRPGLTAAAFVPHPFSQTPGARLYRTGDRARYLEDGNLVFVGRADHQVKIRGFRVELNEIAAVLRGHHAVDDAVVVVQGTHNPNLVAYVQSATLTDADQAELRADLAGHLPHYMVPNAFCLLKQFPLNSSGKIDRGALPAVDLQGAATGDAPPQGKAEQTLAAIWCDVLGLEQISRHANFFELGGNSLLVIRVNGLLRERCQVELTTRLFFTCGDLAELAEHLDHTWQNASDNQETLNDLFDMLDGMSDNEALALSTDT